MSGKFYEDKNDNNLNKDKNSNSDLEKLTGYYNGKLEFSL